MDQKLISVLVIAVLAVAGVGGAVLFLHTGDDPQYGVEVDAVGRDFEIPDSLDGGIVTLGSSGALRFLSIFDVYEHIIEVDYGDVNDAKNGRAYSYAYPMESYPDIETHPDVPKSSFSNETAEKIANKHPSLIITLKSVYEQFPSQMNFLDKSVNILVLFDQTWGGFVDGDFKVSDHYRYNVQMIGKVLKNETRAEEHIDGVQNIIDDIRSTVADSGKEGKRIYVAGVTKGGSNQWYYTFPEYMPFDITGAKNSYEGNQLGGKVELSTDDAMNTICSSDMMIIDPSSCDKIGEKSNQDLMKLLYLKQEAGELCDMYVTCPIVWDHINYDMVLVCSYYLLHLQYGYDMTEADKAIANVFDVYYGEHGMDVLNDMKQFFVEKCRNEKTGFPVELPIFSEIKIVKTSVNGEYAYVTAPAA